MKLVFLALAGGGAGHEANRAAQERTWANNQDPNFRIIWVIFDKKVEYPVLDGNTLLVPGTERYEGLLEKSLIAVKWIVENLQFDFLIRTNTSNYFDQSEVVRALKEIDPNEPAVGGFVGKWGRVHDGPYQTKYISGAGIFLTRKASQILTRCKSTNYIEIPDDVAIGDFLRRNSVSFFKVGRNNITDFEVFKFSPQSRVKSYMNDSVTEERFELLHQIYKYDHLFDFKKFLYYEIKNCKKENPIKLPKFLVSTILIYPWTIHKLKKRRASSN